jgi:hypothetical protein
LENEARLAGEQVESLKQTLAAQAKTVAEGDQDNVQLRALQLDANTARDQLESYVQKYREAIARDADNAAPADARVIAPATEPRYPTFPKKAPTLLLGTLAGFLLGAGIVVSRALLEEGEDATVVRRARQPPSLPVRRAPVVQPAAEAALSEEAEPPPAFDEEQDAGEPVPAPRFDFGGVRDLLAHGEERHSAETRFMLLAGAGDGASRVTALGLGRALAAKGRAVLVDLGPGPQSWLRDVARFQGDRFVGLSDALSSAASFEAALHRDASSHLDILPAGESDAAIAEDLDEALIALVDSYDFVVVHADDWRDETAQVGAELIKEMIVVADARRLPMALDEARALLGGSYAILGCVAAARRARYERAA